ncbi:MAG: hypothetical protein HYU64_06245 [Armatimonadetes bacterium]|nr:hypothetical protein [Armatimonadota bacterium]
MAEGYPGFLRRNLNLKLLALGLAVFLWFYVHYTQDPGTRSAFEASLKIPLSVENMGANLALVEPPEEVVVTVRGARQIVEGLRPEHFRASVDVKAKKSGFYQSLPVIVSKPPGVKVTSTDPAKVGVQLDTLDDKSLTVEVRISGRPQEGFTPGTPTVKPKELRIRGPQSKLILAKRLMVQTDLSDEDQVDVVQEASPKVLGETGKEIKGLALDPGTVQIRIPVRPSLARRPLIVMPQIVGHVASGYAIRDIYVEPQVVEGAVPFDKLKTTRSIKTTPVVVEGIVKDLQRQASLIAENGVTLERPERVTVKIMVVRLKSK